VYVDVKYLPQMPDEDQCTDLFVAVDRATRRVYVEILKETSRQPPPTASSSA